MVAGEEEWSERCMKWGEKSPLYWVTTTDEIHALCTARLTSHVYVLDKNVFTAERKDGTSQTVSKCCKNQKEKNGGLNCYKFVISYCCNTSGGKTMFYAKDGTVLKRPFGKMLHNDERHSELMWLQGSKDKEIENIQSKMKGNT